MKGKYLVNILMGAATFAIGVITADAEVTSDQQGRIITSINHGWKFRSERDSLFEKINIPHSWNKDAYTTKNYFRGKGIYQRPLTVNAADDNRRYFLKLDGAATRSEISVNRKSVGSHTGAYSPHIVDITDAINRDSINLITVEVNNADKYIPPSSADFTFMGGLYRDAWLIGLPSVHMDITNGPACGFKVTPKHNSDGWQLDIASTVVNSNPTKKNIVLHAVLFDKDGQKIASGKKRLTILPHDKSDCELVIKNLRDIELWSPENPTLYTVKLSVEEGDRVIDSAETYTGFRTFGFDSENRFTLNGQPYKLRGMCRHQDMYPMGIALSDDQHRRDIKMIKDLGANFIRISHYPQDDAVLEMCDRLGLIAWEEVPVIDYIPDDPEFAENCETMLRDMIRAHYNHPAIAMWGYMNEILIKTPQNDRENTFRRTRKLADKLENIVKTEDPARLSTMAFHGNEIYHEADMSDITDVIGWNLYQGWYGDQLTDFEKFLSRQHAEHPHHKLIVSEFGAGSDLRLHSLQPEIFDFTPEYQQKYLEHYLPVIEDSTFIAGASYWNFIDFSAAHRAESMPHINNKGVVTNDRRKKDIYYFFAASWIDPAKDTVAHSAVRDWPDRTEIFENCDNISRPIKVYTNLPEVILCVNGKSSQKQEVKNHTAIFNSELIRGKNIIELYDGDKLLDATQVNVTPIEMSEGCFILGADPLAINVGSNAYFRSNYDDVTWLPDKIYTSSSGYGYTGGKSTASLSDIDLTDDDPLLQRAVNDIEEYRIDVAPGKYEVELLFADTSSKGEASAYMLGRNDTNDASDRIAMQIFINGNEVEECLYPALEAGYKTMMKKRYQCEVGNDKKISVEFRPVNGSTTSLSGIKVRKL